VCTLKQRTNALADAINPSTLGCSRPSAARRLSTGPSRDGKLHVTSASGAGTTLHVTLPLDSTKPGDAGHWRTG
jgi:hypothetical protein